MNVLDIFCGAGGLSQGFKNAGFNIIAGIDNDQESIETYAYNFPGAISSLTDLSQKLNYDNLDFINNKIDILVGGPPCQGFSVAGKRMAEDPRNKLYKIYMDLIKTISPSALVLENVPSLRSLYNGYIFKNILSDFKKLDYKTHVWILNADDYGVPQSRKRIFIIGLKNNKLLIEPEKTTPINKITCSMAISDLPALKNQSGAMELDYKNGPNSDYQRIMRMNSKKLYNHWRVEHKEKTIEIIKLVPDGGNYKTLPKHLQTTRRVNIAWTRMNSSKPCFTIDAGHNHHFHYAANRVPTVRESARIQSFQDKFKFIGRKGSQFRQVGNAVPPILAYHIAKKLKEVL